MQVAMFMDADGSLRANVAAPCEVLGWFLEQDVQNDIAWGRELISIVDNVVTGKRSTWQGTGNAHTLTLTPGEAHIENEYTQDVRPCSISPDTFKQVLTDWIDFIHLRQSTSH